MKDEIEVENKNNLVTRSSLRCRVKKTMNRSVDDHEPPKKILRKIVKAEKSVKCRFCLAELKSLKSVKITKEIEEKFTKLIGIAFKTSENYSKIICKSCNKKLEEFSEFQQKLYEIQKKLYEDHREDESDCDEDRKSGIFDHEDQTFDYDSLGFIKTEEIMVKIERLEEEDFAVKVHPVEELKVLEENVEEKKKRSRKRKKVHKKSSEEESICPICALILKKESMKKHYELHQKKLHDIALVCDICNYKCYNRKARLREHMLIKHSTDEELKTRFKCSHCPKTFYTSYRKKLHEKFVHEKVLDAFSCMCGRTYSSKSSLHSHMKNFHAKGVFWCTAPGCTKQLSTPDQLRVHIIREHKEKKACEVCGKLVPPGKFYNDHLRRHEKPIQCPVEGCAKVLVRDSLPLHMKCEHGPDLKLKCPTCNSEFQNQHKLNQHIRRQHQAVKVPCLVDGCKHSTARKAFMVMHIKNHRDISEDYRTKLLEDLKKIKMAQ